MSYVVYNYSSILFFFSDTLQTLFPISATNSTKDDNNQKNVSNITSRNDMFKIEKKLSELKYKLEKVSIFPTVLIVVMLLTVSLSILIAIFHFLS